MPLLPFCVLLVYADALSSLPSTPRHTIVSPRRLSQLAMNIEEGLKLQRNIDSCAFLNNINEYGNARMARRAVGVLQKMPAYFVSPTTEHYNAAILACEKSQQFQLAMSVFDQMKADDVPRNIYTYTHLISCADKSNKFEEGYQLFQQCKHEKDLEMTTEIYNNMIWLAEHAENPKLIISLLNEMEMKNIPRDHRTYLAASNACNRCGDGDTALHILDLMASEKIPLDPAMGQAVLWSCVKSGMAEEALQIFDFMEDIGITRGPEAYEGAIWACELRGDWERAVELLRLMKVDKNFKRQTIAFDGAISALCKAGQWEKARELMTWMDREPAPKSHVTYRNVIDALYEADQMELVDEVYILCLRDNFYSPWVKGEMIYTRNIFQSCVALGTRAVDVSDMSISLTYCAIKNVLQSFLDGKMAPFDLRIIFSDSAHDTGHTFTTMEEIIRYLDEDRVLKLIEVDNEDGYRKILIKREHLLSFCAIQRKA